MPNSLSHCFTWAGPLNLSSASRPSKPFALVANGKSWIAPYCSSWTQIIQELVTGDFTAPISGVPIFALMARAEDTTSDQVAGAFSGSRPAAAKASLLYHITAVDELNGIDANRPSVRL